MSDSPIEEKDFQPVVNAHGSYKKNKTSYYVHCFYGSLSSLKNKNIQILNEIDLW